jgi:hypothetical protein
VFRGSKYSGGYKVKWLEQKYQKSLGQIVILKKTKCSNTIMLIQFVGTKSVEEKSKTKEARSKNHERNRCRLVKLAYFLAV